MNKSILVTVEPDETRVAVLEDGRLVEIYHERPSTQRVAGNIYKGRVENVLPGMQAAFVNIGLERNAFLYVADAVPRGDEADDADDLPDDIRHAAITDILRPGQEIIVQITKEPTGTKGARVTRHLTLPGRLLVLMPGVNYVGVSRRIHDEKERQRLKQLAQELQPAGAGLIVRTAAEGRSEAELRGDVAYLTRLWADIQQRARRQRAPVLLYRDLGLVFRVVRDMLTPEVDQVLIDDPGEYRRVLDLMAAFATPLRDRVQLYQNREISLFEQFGVNEEIERALKRRVWLKSGGYLVIDQTEALTAIDVNTGKFVGSKNLADTVFRTNMEAAAEIARQLRLRDIGGIIVIDFIDMEEPAHRQRVVQELERHLARDHTKATVLGITALGLVEMTRKKGRRSLLEQLTRECPYCEGRGRVLSEESAARRVRREIKRILRHSPSEAILVEVHPSVASLLIGAGGANLRELERETGRSVFIRGREDVHLEAMHLVALGSREEVERQALPVHAGQRLELEVEERHASNQADGIARLEGYVIDIQGAGDRVGQRVVVEITRAYRTYARARVVS
ncbi:Rne/Rng family ribonuclease [Thermaerobacter subterraneus]|uniref:Ribonuclease G n=1 Tax=Thermaerobacter subterraneus DSM 13965 TaxID=867903 RepID=K6Q1S6_9FIRM|nr:Rne/Rng family ribonuclease [Thermaerobacter subterraneus]EKP94934.1 RNAse G [Thermaerobacter subterraneus DSM 13965]